jgi:hypothetical protein
MLLLTVHRVRHRRVRKIYNFSIIKELKKYPIVVLDGAPHSRASAVTDLAASDDPVFVTLPAYSPEFDSVEECRRQPQEALSNPFFDSPGEPTAAIDTAPDHLHLSK